MRLTDRGRRAVMTAILLASIACIFIVASAVSSHFFERSAQVASPRPRAQAGEGLPGDVELFRVAALEGPAETFHDGQWYVVQAGDSLTLQDVVRTPRGSRALLRRGSAEIEVKENVDIRLDRLADTTATFDVLRGGNVTANVGAQKETLEIATREARTVNRGTARWVVSLGPTGQVSVAATTGEVRFSSHGKDVQLHAGMQSTATTGGAPTEPEAIPADLFLSVVWPELGHSDARAPIKGKVEPSSTVRVNGVSTDVAPDGTFQLAPGLAVGANRVEVSAEDITGRKKVLSRVITREAPAPALQPSTGALWKP